MTYSIEKIEGIGPNYGEQLRNLGIKTTDDLLKEAKTSQQRGQLAQKIEHCDAKQVLEWVNRADLMRVIGVGEEFSDLLENTGVDTVKELAQRDPDHLFVKLEVTNFECKFTRRDPNLKEVRDWIRKAKNMGAGIEY